MEEDLELFASKGERFFVKVENFLCLFGGLIQNKSETTALTIREGLNLARTDVTVVLEEVEELFLGNFGSEVTD